MPKLHRVAPPFVPRALVLEVAGLEVARLGTAFSAARAAAFPAPRTAAFPAHRDGGVRGTGPAFDGNARVSTPQGELAGSAVSAAVSAETVRRAASTGVL
jgi:hypothetical protein